MKTDQQYLDYYNNLKDECDIPIFEKIVLTRNEIPTEDKYKPGKLFALNNTHGGAFIKIFDLSKKRHVVGCYILINPNLILEQKIEALLHEIGHYIYYKECYNNSNYSKLNNEFFAMTYCINTLKKNKLYAIHANAVDNCKFFLELEYHTDHVVNEVLKRILDADWKKLIKYQNASLIFFHPK